MDGLVKEEGVTTLASLASLKLSIVLGWRAMAVKLVILICVSCASEHL